MNVFENTEVENNAFKPFAYLSDAHLGDPLSWWNQLTLAHKSISDKAFIEFNEIAFQLATSTLSDDD